MERELAALESKLQRKDEVIAEPSAREMAKGGAFARQGSAGRRWQIMEGLVRTKEHLGGS